MKMLARIRASKSDHNIQLLHMDHDGSHDGGSGDAGIDDDTYRLAFILNELGLGSEISPPSSTAAIGSPNIAKHMTTMSRYGVGCQWLRRRCHKSINQN
jgi:hypothetical protein